MTGTSFCLSLVAKNILFAEFVVGESVFGVLH